MEKYHRLALTLGLFQALSTHAIARPNQFLELSLEELMDVEVTISTDTQLKIGEAPSLVTVISAEDLKLTGATNLVDALESVPGVHIWSNGFANRPQVHFRGATNAQTLLMINGNPMRDLIWSLGIFWKGLPVSVIERVEIIRGPGSALFGSDASGGVINVITKTAGLIESSEAGIRVGGFDTQSVWAQHGTEVNGYKIGITADIQTTDGHSPYIFSDRQTGDDPGISYAPGNASFGWNSLDLRMSLARDNWNIQMAYMSHDDLEIGLTGAGVLDPVTQAEDSRLNIDWLYSNQHFHPVWGLEAEIRFQHLDYSSNNGFQERPPGFSGGDYPDGQLNYLSSAERRVTTKISGLYSGFDDHAIKIGSGLSWQDLYRIEQSVNFGTGPDGSPIPAGSPLVSLTDTPFAFAPEKARTIGHIFIQDIWSITDDWQLTTGLRFDHYSDFGNSLNPRVALVWQTSDKLTTKLLYGQAFLAPSFQQLFAETSFTLPDPDLSPEQSETIDLAFGYQANKDLFIGLNIFHFELTDIIGLIDTGLDKRQYQNAGDHSIRGIEIEAHWQATRNIRLSANYTHRTQSNSSFKAVNQPSQDAYFRMDWGFHPNWNWNTQANWIGERERSITDTRNNVDDYLITDMTLRYTRKNQWEFAASVRNIFDIDGREYTGKSITNDLPVAGRSAFAEIRYKF